MTELVVTAGAISRTKLQSSPPIQSQIITINKLTPNVLRAGCPSCRQINSVMTALCKCAIGIIIDIRHFHYLVLTYLDTFCRLLLPRYVMRLLHVEVLVFGL